MPKKTLASAHDSFQFPIVAFLAMMLLRKDESYHIYDAACVLSKMQFIMRLRIMHHIMGQLEEVTAQASTIDHVNMDANWIQ
jgi:hypothetical protein